MSLSFRKFCFREAQNRSPVETIHQDRQTSGQLVYADWLTRRAFARELLGYSTTYTLNTIANGENLFTTYNTSTKSVVTVQKGTDLIPRYISRTIPYFYVPQFDPIAELFDNTQKRSLIATSVSIENDRTPRGFSSNRQQSVYEEALMTINFDTPNYLIYDDDEMIISYQNNSGASWFSRYMNFVPDEAPLWRYVEFEQQEIIEYITVPPLRALYFSDTNKAVSQTYAIPFYRGQISVLWKAVPVEAVPYYAVLDCVGKTNYYNLGIGDNVATPANALIRNMLAGKLVCLEPRRKFYRQSNGGFVCDVLYRFDYYPNGANYLYDISRGGFYPIVVKTGGTSAPLFPYADFNNLFRPDPVTSTGAFTFWW